MDFIILALFQLFRLSFAFAPDLQNILLEKKNRKEVIQPHVPVRLPCYDLAPITSFTFGLST